MGADKVKADKSKEKPKPVEEGKAVTTQPTSCSKPKKKATTEIDEIFAAAKKRKRLEKEANDAKAKQNKSSISSANKKHGNKGVGKSGRRRMEGSLQAGNSSRSRKKIVDGLTIYTEEELGLGKADAGGTALCPFDCDCCF